MQRARSETQLAIRYPMSNFQTPISVSAALLLWFVFATPAKAQQDDEPLFGALVQMFKTKQLRLGALLQVLGDFQSERDAIEGNNGFSLPRVRMSFRGDLDHRITYAVEAELSRTPTLGDAWVRVTLSPAFAVDVGHYKVPFSGERLQSTPTLEFINRAQIVRAFAPGRQIGVQLRGEIPGTGLRYLAGAFNGNAPRSLLNDGNDLMFAGRIVARIDSFSTGAATDAIEFGINAVRSHDEEVTLGYNLATTFQGTRTLLGADIRVEREPFVLTGEYIGSRLEDEDVASVTKPHGLQASITYKLGAREKLHARWDSFSGDGRRPSRDLAILGWSHQISTPVKFQMNYVYPSGEPFSRHQLLTQMQFYF